MNEFSWLQCDSSAGMICTVCKKYESVGSFVTGCTNFKVQTIKKHALSENHIKNELKAKATSTSSESIGEKSLSLLNAAARNKLRLLFSNAHYIAKLGRPYTDYVQMCSIYLVSVDVACVD